MLVIRLTRKGRKNQPFFRVVVTEKKRSAKGGRAVEIVGHVDPLTKKKALKKDRILHWIKMGAQPSDTVHNLLVSEKIINAKKKHVARVKKPTEATASASAPAGATADKPAAKEAAPSAASASASAEATADKPADRPAEAKPKEKSSTDAKAMADKAENRPAVTPEKPTEPAALEAPKA